MVVRCGRSRAVGSATVGEKKGGGVGKAFPRMEGGGDDTDSLGFESVG